MRYELPQYRIMGDRALLVELGDEISPPVNESVRKLFFGLNRGPIRGVVEVVPGYRSLVIVFNPLIIALPTLQDRVTEIQQTMDQSQMPIPKTVEIPVVYGGEYGPDLEYVAGYHKITPEEVIRLHTGTTYRVYMIGFTPGYPYMGELPDALAIPRKKTPRTAIPRGSVGIAQKQTGIYPTQSPGGWQIIGRTPIRLFDPAKQPPTPLEMGDLVKFLPVSEEKVAQWKL